MFKGRPLLKCLIEWSTSPLMSGGSAAWPLAAGWTYQGYLLPRWTISTPGKPSWYFSYVFYKSGMSLIIILFDAFFWISLFLILKVLSLNLWYSQCTCQKALCLKPWERSTLKGLIYTTLDVRFFNRIVSVCWCTDFISLILGQQFIVTL